MVKGGAGASFLPPPQTFLRPQGAADTQLAQRMLPWNPSPSSDILEIRFPPLKFYVC